jgi:hypothetical protein
MRRGVLRKMQVSPGDEVCYRLPLGEALIDLQPLLGAPVVLEHSGSIFCINCARKTNKSFSQGYCYPCFGGWRRVISVSSNRSYVILTRAPAVSQTGGRHTACSHMWFILPIRPG